MLDQAQKQLREDCRASFAKLADLPKQLAGQRIAVIGGTGFVGSWLAEAVAMLNDDMGAGYRIDLFGRTASKWLDSRRHLERVDIGLHTIDVRSSFELPSDTTPSCSQPALPTRGCRPPTHTASSRPRFTALTMHCSQPHGWSAFNASSTSARALSPGRPAARRAEGGRHRRARLYSFPQPLRRSTARRREPGLCICRPVPYPGQYRQSIHFLGAYQPLDAPWALNNFIRDALTGNDIRIHGDGATRRSYLYGSDVAAWLLQALVAGRDGEVYNIGGGESVSHADAATWVAERITPTPQLVYKSQPRAGGRTHDFYPNVTQTMQSLGVRPVFAPRAAIERSLQWHAHQLGAGRRLRAAT